MEYRNNPKAPAPAITNIGFAFHFLSTDKEPPKSKTAIKSKLSILYEILFPFQKDRMIIDTPAAAINATTAGLSPFIIPWIADNFLYL